MSVDDSYDYLFKSSFLHLELRVRAADSHHTCFPFPLLQLFSSEILALVNPICFLDSQRASFMREQSRLSVSSSP